MNTVGPIRQVVEDRGLVNGPDAPLNVARLDELLDVTGMPRPPH